MPLAWLTGKKLKKLKDKLAINMVFSKENARHENYLARLLTEMLDDPYLAHQAFFKGGTCARWLGILDRFSVDLDFDLSPEADPVEADRRLRAIFQKVGLEIKDASHRELQYFLKYPAPDHERNTLKLDLLTQTYRHNKYHPVFLPIVQRAAICQTPETMFAHKLVAPIDRYRRHQSIAGRDIYDIHQFFMRQMGYSEEIIKERTGISAQEHLSALRDFIDQKISQQKLDEDLNPLLEAEVFSRIRKHLKRETLRFIEGEMARLANQKP